MIHPGGFHYAVFVRASACAGWGWCYFRSSYSIADFGNGLFVTCEIAKGLAKGGLDFSLS